MFNDDLCFQEMRLHFLEVNSFRLNITVCHYFSFKPVVRSTSFTILAMFA